MNRGDVAVLSVIQIVAIRWLKIQRWFLPATVACVALYWLWVVAVYVDAGEWPNMDGVWLTVMLSMPLPLLLGINVVFHRAAIDPEGEFGFLAVMLMALVVPFTLLGLALDAFIILASVRNFAMTGQFLPPLQNI